MRSILGLGALLLLLVPGVGGAREAWGQQPRARLSLMPEATAGGTPASDLSRALRSIDDSMGVSTGARDPLAARVGAEVLLGGLAGAGGLLAGGVVGAVIAELATCGVDECMNGLGYVGAAMVTGIALMAPLGVYAGGQLVDGEGQFLPTLGGSLLGGGVTAVTLAAMNNPITPAGVLVLVLSPLVGSIIGYEVSHFFVSRERRSVAARGVQILPTAGVTSSGTGVLGLVGRF